MSVAGQNFEPLILQDKNVWIEIFHFIMGQLLMRRCPYSLCFQGLGESIKCMPQNIQKLKLLMFLQFECKVIIIEGSNEENSSHAPK